MNKIFGLFPGQGSQQVGMGAAFANRSDTGREIFERADRALGFSISKLCFEGPLEELTLTKFAQPAILVASYAAYTQASLPLTVAAGHSLGEYTALVASGALTFEDAIVLVHKRGRYMQEAVPAGAGKMLAVMGPNEEEIRKVILEVTAGVVEVANLNSPGQTVVAGDAKGVDSFAQLIAQAGAKTIPLNVSAPFHCSLMAPAAEQLAKDLDAIAIANPRFPVYSNATGTASTTAQEVRNRLKAQVCASVRWTDCVQNAVSAYGVTHCVEFGAGGVLTKLLKRINSSIPRFEVSNPESLEKTLVALVS